MRSVRNDTSHEARQLAAVEKKLAWQQFDAFDASQLLLQASNDVERSAAVERIVTAVASRPRRAGRGGKGNGADVAKKSGKAERRECVECGCTDDRACLVEGVPCFWVRKNLCSRCATLAEVQSTERGRTWLALVTAKWKRELRRAKGI